MTTAPRLRRSELAVPAANPRMMLAQLYAQQGDMANAQKQLEKAIEIEPDNERAKQMLSRVKRSQDGN